MKKSIPYILAILFILFATYGVIVAVGRLMNRPRPDAPNPVVDRWEIVCPDVEWNRACIHHNKATGEVRFIAPPADAPVEP